MNINKTDLINALAEKKSYKKYAIKNAIDDIFEEIAEALVRGYSCLPHKQETLVRLQSQPPKKKNKFANSY